MSAPPRPLRACVGGFVAGVAVTLVLGAADPYAGLDLFARALTDIDTQYERPLALVDVVHAALGGVSSVLDEHSVFYPPETWARLRGQDAALRLGIGGTLSPDPCGLRIDTLVPWGPAENLGLAVGDCVVAVDGVALPSSPEPSLLDAPEHTAVRLRIRRGTEEREVALLRTRPQEPALRVEDLPMGMVYVRVGQFGDLVAAPLVRAMAERRGVRGMVLDLRANPGGRVEEAALLLDHFVSTGTLVGTRTRSGGETRLSATKSATDWSFPLMVLIDGETASAAEIVAGALRDHGRATLVGSRTYGKGSVQRVFQYEDGSALKLTVGRYFLPNGEPILDRQGVMPDVSVPLPPSADGSPGVPDLRTPASQRNDPQLAAAIAALSPSKR